MLCLSLWDSLVRLQVESRDYAIRDYPKLKPTNDDQTELIDAKQALRKASNLCRALVDSRQILGDVETSERRRRTLDAHETCVPVRIFQPLLPRRIS
jgi:hypothetical protein